MLIEIEPAWRPSKPELGGLVQTRPVPVGVWGWLEASSFSSDCVLQRGLKGALGDLTGYSPAACGLTAQPTAACGTGSSVARWRALGSRAASPAGFGAFALLDGPGLTQFRVYRV